jgi:monofunctional biosynthetic peptidoglycan transglycosylase
MIATVIAWILRILTVILLLPPLLILVYRFVPPPITPLMVIRSFQGHPRHSSWVPAEEISPEMFRAAIASEDAKFCRHHGFDWQAMNQDFERYEEGIGKLRGASTISMQTAKNLFLWPGRTFLRKGLEAPLTAELELILTKKRIIELYLNIVEMGPGIYGVEAASQAAFHHSARTLNRREAALLAAILPSPLKSSASRPSAYIQRRVGTIEARMEDVPFDRARICAVKQDPLW